MAAKIVVLATVLAACNAVPIWYNELPGVVMRIGRSPDVSYGFGSGFSSNIGGISHSTGIGAAFSSGGAGEAVGYGSANGGAYARGVGIANSNSHPVVHYHQQPTYQPAPRPSYESSVASATNFGNYGNAVSSAQSNNFGSAVSSAQSGGPARFNSAVSSAQNVHGYGSAHSSANTGYGSALSSAHNSGYGASVSSAQTAGRGGYGSSVSSAQTAGHGGYGSSVSAAENNGQFQASTAQVNQLRAGGNQNSGAITINAPGFQAAHSHAINTGFY